MELHFLKACEDRNTYDKIKPYFKDYALSETIATIVESIDSYFETYGKSTIDWDEFASYFYVIKGKKFKTEKAMLFEEALKGVKAVTAGPVVDDIINSLIEKDYATRVYNIGRDLALSRPGVSMDDLVPVLDEYQSTKAKAKDLSHVFVEPNLGYVSSVSASGGFTWRLEELNVALGPVRRGDFILVLARPESGKTTLVSSEVSYFLTQTEGNILWINNEEASHKVMARLIQCFFGITKKELESNRAKYEADFLAAGGSRILIPKDDSNVNSVKAISALAKEVQPALIVFDVLDKVRGFEKTGEEHIRLGHIYMWGRDMAKKYCPVIATSQADASAENVAYIEMNQVRGSKTDKIGEVDACIAIGRLHHDAIPNRRYINIPRNKLWGGPPPYNEAFSHGKFEVDIDPSRGRYISHWKT